jgi:hypothetical protein
LDMLGLEEPLDNQEAVCFEPASISRRNLFKTV